MDSPATGLLSVSFRLIVKETVDFPSAVKLVASDLKTIVLTSGEVFSMSIGSSVISCISLSSEIISFAGVIF